MGGIKDSDRIDNLRQRLYERGKAPQKRANHRLSDKANDVPNVWQRGGETPAQPSPQPTKTAPAAAANVAAPTVDRAPATSTVSTTPVTAAPPQQPPTDMPKQTRRRSYRFKIVLLGLICFVLSLMASSALLLFNNNSISGENISLTVEGPFTVGGGEVLPIDVDIMNNNTAAIESVILIVDYPTGALSAGEERRELYSERLSLEAIEAGETVNVPLRAIVFGEENDQQEVNVRIQYRIANSNGLFEREAEPLQFNISSAPLYVQTESVQRVSSGQETDVVLTIASNSPTPLTDVLVQAEYPLGFVYSGSSPEPYIGQSTWLIDELLPEEDVSIVITGVVEGAETDNYAINFEVGVPSERDLQTMSTVFTTAQTEFEIEAPFLDVDLSVVGGRGGALVIDPSSQTTGDITVSNGLGETIYDVEVVAQFSGNAYNQRGITARNGFFDSNTNEVRWDATTVPDLRELQPGDDVAVQFEIDELASVASAPEVQVVINVNARRVADSVVAETLTGTQSASMKVAGVPTVRADVTHNIGTFADSGPVPPTVGEETTYTISMMAESSINNMTDTVVRATLPTYVSWQSQTSGTGAIVYDEVLREVTWQVGNVPVGSPAFASFQVAIRPSLSQVGREPVLVNKPLLSGVDSFTNTRITNSSPARTTEMSTETGNPAGNGRVIE